MHNTHPDHRVSDTYWFCTKGVVLTFGSTTCPITKIPPPLTPSKQCANIFFTLPVEASCESMDEFDFPKPSIPSSASSDESRSPDCLAPHLLKTSEILYHKSSTRMHYHLFPRCTKTFVTEKEKRASLTAI